MLVIQIGNNWEVDSVVLAGVDSVDVESVEVWVLAAAVIVPSEVVEIIVWLWVDAEIIDDV